MVDKLAGRARANAAPFVDFTTKQRNNEDDEAEVGPSGCCRLTWRRFLSYVEDVLSWLGNPRSDCFLTQRRRVTTGGAKAEKAMRAIAVFVVRFGAIPFRLVGPEGLV